MVDAFEYPRSPHVRRHGPDGYTTYESYRPWLRDEFCFRCVLCLHRERWPTTSEYEVDHLIPVSERQDLSCRYTNLLYVCRRCNNLKADLRIPDPCSIAYGNCLRVNDDGTIESLNEKGRVLVRTLRLDRADRVRQRRMIIEILIDAQETGNTRRLRDWLGFPEDLDNLRKLHPPTNHRLEGIGESWFSRRERCELPETY
ncbi:MAG: HNH endonuclease [Pirellulaceae bacterium]|nr:HNH endonuclease [Pirellulaceae bacterium]